MWSKETKQEGCKTWGVQEIKHRRQDLRKGGYIYKKGGSRSMGRRQEVRLKKWTISWDGLVFYWQIFVKKGLGKFSEALLTFGEGEKFSYGFPPILLDAITFNFKKCKISVVCKYKLTKIKQLRSWFANPPVNGKQELAVAPNNEKG